MKSVIISLLVALSLAACTSDDAYPGSGEECRAEDPVQTLDVSDCASLPIPSGGTF